ncbi:MAG: hypothetical protein BZ133_08100 [Methanosphaera sp. SHI613]|jgi:hypothetical protein|nr:MAG: hypothetical protein BZ133_08100 [Methanosphaera sp. SHI613]
MKNSLKDLTVNVKKSIDREYDGEFNVDQSFNDNQKMLNDSIISSIGDSYSDYDDDFDDITVEHDDDTILIEPDRGANIDTIRLIKVKSVYTLNDELDNVNKTGVPAIIDLKYIQERRSSEFAKLGSMIKEFKQSTGAQVVLLGSTKNVIVVVPKDIVLLTH